MNYSEFTESINTNEPPESLPVHLKALWYDAKENWKEAHDIIDDTEDRNAYWVHAYLHRKEGDKSNASYWYNKAGKNMPSSTLKEEGDEIVNALLNS